MTVNELIKQLKKIPSCNRERTVYISINILPDMNFEISQVEYLLLFSDRGIDIEDSFAVSLRSEVTKEEQNRYEEQIKSQCEFDHAFQEWKHYCNKKFTTTI